MSNPQLTKEQRERLFMPLFEHIKGRLDQLSNGDSRLLWALRRKLAKELTYLERGKPSQRKRLKEQKFSEQVAFCAICGNLLPFKETELDRIDAFGGYTRENTRLVHHKCHREQQKQRGFT
jgi:hypothetical protein